MRVGSVEKFHYERVVLELLLHDAPLDTSAAAVDQPHFAYPRRLSLEDIFSDDGRNVRGREGMEIQEIFDGKTDRVLILHLVISRSGQ